MVQPVPGVSDPNGIAFPSTYKDPTQTTNYSNVAINFAGQWKDLRRLTGANPEYILGIEALTALAVAGFSRQKRRRCRGGNTGDVERTDGLL